LTNTSSARWIDDEKTDTSGISAKMITSYSKYKNNINKIIYYNSLIFLPSRRRIALKRILVKDNLNTRINSLEELIREGNRVSVDLNKKIKLQRKLFREGERSTIEIRSLQRVQEQFDNLIKQMIQAKMLLTGFEMGGDDAYYEEYEDK
jgi:predicted DNA-binding antitoxin AbrB/MazE fold protein